MKKILSVFLVLGVMMAVSGFAIAIPQDFDGTTTDVSITPETLNFGAIFNGQSFPMDTTFVVTPAGSIDDFDLFISNVELNSLIEIAEEDVLFKATGDSDFQSVADFLAGTPLLVDGSPTHSVKLSGVSAAEGTAISGTIVYTIASPFDA